MVNIIDIAKEAGVSKSTVSRYLNNGSVSAETKRKISKIIERTGYSPNSFARSLKAKKTNFIGVVIPRLYSYSISSTLQGIDRKLRIEGYNMLISNSYQEIEREVESLNTFSNQKVDGIIFFATELTDKHLMTLKSLTTPVIIVGQEVEGYHSIVYDDYEAGYQIGSYASELGHRKFLLLSISEKDIAVGIKRRNGIIDGLKNIKNDIEIEEITTDFQLETAYIKALKVLPTTKASYIVCATDSIALGVMKAANSLNISIPSEKSISGFGNHDISEAVFPAITTVDYPYLKAGEIAADKIIKLINEESISDTYSLEGNLVIRDSTEEF